MKKTEALIGHSFAFGGEAMASVVSNILSGAARLADVNLNDDQDAEFVSAATLDILDSVCTLLSVPRRPSVLRQLHRLWMSMADADYEFCSDFVALVWRRVQEDDWTDLEDSEEAA